MKKHLSSLLLIAALLVPWASKAQPTMVTVGNWSSTTASAYGGFHNTSRYSWTQTLYTQAEMGGAGWIRAIVFDDRSTASNTADSVKIYLGTTSMTSHPTAAVTTWVPMSDLTLVWSRTAYVFPGTVGQLVVELDQPFYYDGTSTLAVVVSKAAAATSTNTKFGYTSTTASIKYTGSTTESYCRFPTVAGTNGTYKQNLKFVVTANSNDAFLMPVAGLCITGADINAMTVAWNAASGCTYQVGYAPVAGSAGSATITPVSVTDTTYTVTGLSANTEYWIYVRKVQGEVLSTWDSIKVRTLMQPASLPLMADFDLASDDSLWAFSNANNAWYIDSLDGRRCMFISNDAGLTNAYTTTTNGYSWAWRDVTFAAGRYSVEFDWRAYGEGNWDYLRVALVPTNVMLTSTYTDWGDGSSFTSNAFRTYLPDGWINISNTVDGQYKLNLESAWNHFGGEINIPDSLAGTYHLAIFWCNDGSGGTQPPAAIDNISIEATSCYAASECVVTDLTVSSATITLSHDIATTFLGMIRKVGTELYDTVEINGMSYTFTGLQMGIPYEGLVYTLCGDDTSAMPLPFTFTTVCSTITSDMLPYGEDFEAYGTGAANPISPCWNKGALGTTTNYPYPYATAAINGNRGLYFYSVKSSSSDYCSWAALPPIDESLYMNDLQINFNVKRGTSATSTYFCRLYIGVADSLAGFVSATALEAGVDWVDTVDFSTAAASSVHSVEVVFDNYTGTGRYIVIYAPAVNVGTTNYNVVYVDDVVLRNIPSCFWPTAIALDSIASDAATLSWTPDSRTSSPSSWNVEYGPSGFLPGTGYTETVYDTVVTLYNLTPNTDYDIYVSADCSGDVSDPASSVFHTLCVPVPTDSLPYLEDFESYTSGAANPISPCWYKNVIGSTTAYPYPSTAAAVSGNMGLYTYAYGSVYEYAVLPLFEAPVGSLMLDFDLKRGSSSGTSYHTMAYVGVMTNAEDLSTFDTVAFFDDSDNPVNSVTHHRVSFAGYEGSGRIAFLYPRPTISSHYNYAHTDNVAVNLLPSCLWPVHFAADSVGAYAIQFSWTGNADSYEVQYASNANFTTGAASVVVNDTAALVTGLTEYTEYYFRVRGLCDGDTSEWSEVLNLRTTHDCGPGSINIIDTIGQGTSATSSYTFCTTSSYRTGYSSSIYTAQELSDMGIQINNRINSISLHSGSTGGTIRQASVYIAETDLAAYGNPAANDTTPRTAMTLVYSGDLVIPANSWVEIPFDSAFLYSGNNNLLVSLIHDTNTTAAVTFYYSSTSPDYLSCYGYRSSATTANNTAVRTYLRPNMIFNICTEIPTCVRPSGVATLSVTDTAATIAWSGSAAGYDVAVSPTSIDPDSVVAPILLTTTDTTVTIGGLSPSTTYYYYVRSLCGTIGNSEWSLEGTFTTACSPMTLPYSEDFETYGTGAASAIDPCWLRVSNSSTQYPYPYSTNPVNGQRSLYFYSTHTSSSSYYSYAVLPMFADSVNHLYLSMNVRRYGTTTDSYTTNLKVGVISNPNDITTFVPVQTIDLKNAPALSVHGIEVYFNTYTGDGKYIAIVDDVSDLPYYGTATTLYSYAYVDDIVVDVIPTCPRVANVTVSDIDYSTAMVRWTASAVEGASYEVEYGPEGFTPGSGTVVAATADSIQLTGLQHSTTYDLYVRAICSATDYSVNSFVVSFSTSCGLRSLPLTMDFEGEAYGTSAPLPLCWNRWSNAMSGSYGYYPYVANSSTTAHGGNNYLYWYFSTTSSYPSDQIFVTPPIDTVNFPMNQVEVNFWAKRSTNRMRVIVGVMTDPSDENTFTAIDTLQLNSSYTEFNVPLTAYTGHGNYVAFRGVRDTSAAVYIYIDDITLSRISPCERVYDIVVEDVNQNSVTIGWTDTIASSQWMVSYQAEGDTAWTELTANANPFTITGLAPTTTYTVRVAPVCFNGEVADWNREPLTFCTSQVPASLPYSYNFENPAEWANWQTASNNMVGWYRGNVATGNNTYAAYISADSGATHSWNMNLVTNAAMYRDVDFGPVPGSFTITYDAIVGGSTDGNYDGISILVVDPSVPVVSSSTSLTSPWEHVTTVYVHNDTVWGTHTFNVDGISGVKRVVFFHFNQATASSHPYVDVPSAVDNISIVMQPCARPVNLTAGSIATDGATLTWYGDDTALYQVTWRVQGTDASTNVFDTVTGTTYRATGLTPNTGYYCWVRKVCTLTATDTVVSSWSDGIAFTTLCVPISVADTLHEGFEGIANQTLYSATDGLMPGCWDSWSSGGAAVYPHVTDTGSYSYWVEGDAGLTLTSAGNSTNYGSNSYAIMPNIVEPTNSLTLAFWYCMESYTAGELTVGYLLGNDYEADFVPVKTMSPTSDATHSGNGLQTTRGLRDTVHFDSVPAGNFRIAFRWHKESTFYSVCIDDVSLWTSYTCYAPDVTAVVDYQSATVTAVGTGIDYQLVYGTDPAAMADTMSSATGIFAITGLTPSTQYFYAVRQQCDTTEFSFWTEGTFTTDELPCFAPTDLNVVATTFTSATIGWTSTSSATTWVVEIGGAGVQRFDTVGTNPYTVTGLHYNQQYTASVRAICLQGVVESPWSDTLTFRTDACAPVTGVAVTDITANSAKVGWQPASDAIAYNVFYGDSNFYDNEALTAEVPATDTSYTMTGLEEESAYEVYVQTKCAEGVFSVVTAADRVSFRTTAGGSEGIYDAESGTLTLFPNPASTSVTVTVSGMEGEVTVEIVDLNGRTSGKWTEDSGQIELDVSGLSQGAYFVRVTGERQTVVRKLIVR